MNKTQSLSKKLSLAFSLFALVSVSALAEGNGSFAQQHPRRKEINMREKKQAARIKEGVQEGTITKDQAHVLRAQNKSIKAQERAAVLQNGGHLTKEQQHDLNQQLNTNGAAIHNERHNDAPPPAGTAAAPAPAAE